MGTPRNEVGHFFWDRLGPLFSIKYFLGDFMDPPLSQLRSKVEEIDNTHSEVHIHDLLIYDRQ